MARESVRQFAMKVLDHPNRKDIKQLRRFTTVKELENRGRVHLCRDLTRLNKIAVKSEVIQQRIQDGKIVLPEVPEMVIAS